MHQYIVALALLLASVVAAQAQGRRFTVLAEPAFVAKGHAELGRGADLRAFATGQDGFSGSFSARQTAQTLGY